MHDTWVLSERQYGTYAANWTYGMCMSILDVQTWPGGDVPDLEIITVASWINV
jgi:hypothetical protein